MDFRRKNISKVLAIALMFACAAAFTPLLAGPAFAKTKAKSVKPAQVQGLELVQADTMTTLNEYDVTATWTKLKKNVKKYKIKIADVTDPDAKPAPQTITVKKKKNIAVFSGTVDSTYTVKVRAIKGKKKGKWSDPQTITIAEKRAALTAVTITMPREKVAKAGDKLTAAVDPADADVTWQWYRVKGDEATAIEGAVNAEYTVQSADIGYFLKAVASVSEGSLAYVGSAEATTTVAVTTTSSGGTVKPTPTPTPASDEYIEDILTRAYNYNYPDDYKYNADPVTIKGNTLTATYQIKATLSDNNPAVILAGLVSKFKNDKIVSNDLSRVLGGLYYSTHPKVSGQPNDSSSDDVQNPITRLKVGGYDYEWLIGNLKGSNWRINPEEYNLEELPYVTSTQDSTQGPTLVGNISSVSDSTYLCSAVGAIAVGQMPTPVVSAQEGDGHVGPKKEITESIASGSRTFKECITVVVCDKKYPNGYTINLEANFVFTDQSLFNYVTGVYSTP